MCEIIAINAFFLQIKHALWKLKPGDNGTTFLPPQGLEMRQLAGSQMAVRQGATPPVNAPDSQASYILNQKNSQRL